MNMPANQKNAGFTLLEMMLAMAVTMVLLYTAVMIFRDATYSNQTVVQAADMSDNLRAGLNLIEQDLQQAGQGIPVGGISIPYTSNGSTTSPCSTTPAINRPMLGGATTFPPCNSTMPAIEPGNELGPPITAPDAVSGTVQNPNSITDEITMLFADNTLGLQAKPINQPPTASPPTTGCPNGSLAMSGTTLTVSFDATNCINLSASAYTTVNVGDLIMFTNTNGNAILAVTAASGNTLTFASGDGFKLNGRTESSGTIQQLENSPTCGGAASCFPSTTATRVWMVTYYLDDVTSPPFVRLIRQVNLNAATPVGETMENLQFTYNFVDGALNPSNQATVPAGNSESQIRSVNVYLGARSSYAVRNGNTDSYARSNLMTQVSLRSMAYTNRYK